MKYFSDVIITQVNAKYYILSERDSRFGIGPNGSNIGKPCHTTRSFFAPTRLFSEISLTHEDENGPYLEATVTILGKQRKAIDFGTKKAP
jgi:hypothetical protein